MFENILIFNIKSVKIIFIRLINHAFPQNSIYFLHKKLTKIPNQIEMYFFEAFFLTVSN